MATTSLIPYLHRGRGCGLSTSCEGCTTLILLFQIDKCKVEEMEISQQLRILNDKFTEIKVDTQKEIARLVQERVQLYHQIETVREEYECLKVVQATGITDYQAQLEHASKVRTSLKSGLKIISMSSLASFLRYSLPAFQIL